MRKHLRYKILIVISLTSIVGFVLAGNFRPDVFGFDELGRSIDFLVVKGYKDVMEVTFLISFLSIAVGMMTAYMGLLNSKIKAVYEGLKNIIYGLPPLITALIFMKLFFEDVDTRKTGFLIISFAFSWVMAHEAFSGRFGVLYSSTMVKASIALGLNRWRILVFHIIPNSIERILTAFFDNFRFVFNLYLTIGFLGFGIPDSLGDLIGANFLSAMGYFDVKSGMLLLFSPYIPYVSHHFGYDCGVPGKVVYIAIGYVMWTIIYMRILRVSILGVLKEHLR